MEQAVLSLVVQEVHLWVLQVSPFLPTEEAVINTEEVQELQVASVELSVPWARLLLTTLEVFLSTLRLV